MEYKDLNLKINQQVKQIPNRNIKVLQYLPILDKNDLIEIALQNAEEDGIYNDILLEMYFNLYIVYMYSDLIFTDEDKLDESEIYDILESNGIISEIIAAIPQNEYQNLLDFLQIMKKNKTKYRNSVSSAIKNFVEDMPVNAQQAMEIMQNFNPKDYKEVKNFAQAANGNRPIPKIKD